MYKPLLLFLLASVIAPLCGSQKVEPDSNVNQADEIELDFDMHTSLIEACMTNSIRARDTEDGIQILYPHFQNLDVIYHISLVQARLCMTRVHDMTCSWYKEGSRMRAFRTLSYSQKLAYLQNTDSRAQQEVYYTLSLMRWLDFTMKPEKYGCYDLLCEQIREIFDTNKKVLADTIPVNNGPQQADFLQELQKDELLIPYEKMKTMIQDQKKNSHEIWKNRLMWRNILWHSTTADEINEGAQLPLLFPADVKIQRLIQLKKVLIQELKEKQLRKKKWKVYNIF